MKSLRDYLWEATTCDTADYQTPTSDGVGDDIKTRYIPLMGGMTKKVSMKSIHGDMVKTHTPEDFIWQEDQYRQAFDNMDSFSLSFHSTDKYVEDKSKIFLFKDRTLTPKERHPDNAEMQTFGRTNDILDKIGFYMTKNPDIKPIKINRFSDIEGVKGTIKQNESGDIVHTYPLNEDITLELVDLSDRLGKTFEYIEEGDMCQFIMKREDQSGYLGTD